MGGRGSTRFLNATLFGPLGAPLLRAVSRVTGPRLFGRIFMTVVSSFSRLTRRLSGARKVERQATIGIPLPDTEIRVLDLETGEPIALDEMARDSRCGELVMRGPQTMLGYWPEAGEGLGSGGFVHTGDVVRMDARGYFSIIDRIKDMIIVSGFKVYTKEVDDVLHGHPATELAATIGIPDPEREGSEQVVVFVQLKEEYRGKVTEEEFLEWVKARVARYAAPRAVVFVEEMPVTEVLKIKKNELRRLAAERLGWEELPAPES